MTKEKKVNRKDNKGKVLRKGESQRKDGTYMFRFTDECKKRKSIYAKTLAELREKELKEIKWITFDYLLIIQLHS